MGMGPILTYRDVDHLKEILGAARRADIKIRPIGDGSCLNEVEFRRGLGRVRGSKWGESSGDLAIYLVCNHGSPLFWLSDMRLVRDLEEIFLANGASLLPYEGD